MRRADRLRDQLEKEIVTGLLAPGARLDEQALADRFT
jgi:DNA-binding GntR family transcriptional regulator